MALKRDLGCILEPPELKQALHSAKIEAQLERSLHAVDTATQDENNRKLRLQMMLLEDENEDLHDQLLQEEDWARRLEQGQDDALSRVYELESEGERLANELSRATRELDMTKAEVESLQNVSADSTKILTEKLALTREVAVMKPELEHLRSQAAAHQALLSEKLALQRELSTIQVELENEKRATQRAIAREGRSDEVEAEYRSQIDELRHEMAKMKNDQDKTQKALAKAEAELESGKRATQQLQAMKANLADLEAKHARQADQYREELELEKRAHEKSQLALQKALAKSEKEVQLAQQAAAASTTTQENEHIGDLEDALATEKSEREKVERLSQKQQGEWKAEKANLQEKLNSFRTKLRTTKEQLKQSENDLQMVQANAAAKAKDHEKPPSKNPRKRGAIHIEPDAIIGTPGNALPAKRGKRASTTVPGDKSTFSITPFLNRTASIAPESPVSEHAPIVDTDVIGSGEEDDTPSEVPKKAPKRDTATSKSRAAVPGPTNKGGKRGPARKRAALPSLEKVAEEGASENEENRAPTPTATAIGPSITKVVPMKPKFTSGRKSMALAVNFDDEPPPEKRKKRKLLGGANALGKTLFDVDEGASLKALPGKGLFAARALGKSGLLGKGSARSNLFSAEDGFTFSPLKRDRKVNAAK